MTAGIHASILRDGLPAEPVLLVGFGVPRIHHSDGLPVYHVTEHRNGQAVRLINGKTAQLLAYPSGSVGPGRHTGLFVYARHERLAFNAPLPLFDQGGVYQ